MQEAKEISTHLQGMYLKLVLSGAKVKLCFLVVDDGNNGIAMTRSTPLSEDIIYAS